MVLSSRSPVWAESQNASLTSGQRPPHARVRPDPRLRWAPYPPLLKHRAGAHGKVFPSATRRRWVIRQVGVTSCGRSTIGTPALRQENLFAGARTARRTARFAQAGAAR